MAVVTQTTTQRFVLMDTGTAVTHLLDLGVGEVVQFDDAVITFNEHATISAVASDIIGRGLSLTENALLSLPIEGAVGIDADAAQLRSLLGIPLYEIDFVNMADNAISGPNWITQSVPAGGSLPQLGGVQTTLSLDSQSLISAGFARFLVLRPQTPVKQRTAFATLFLPVNGLASVTVEAEFGSCGQLEVDDTLDVYAILDGTRQLLASYSDDIPATSASWPITLGGTVNEMAIEFISDLGDGNQEGHVIESVRVL